MAQHNAALAHAIAVLAERIERESKEDWRRNAFTGLGLRYAVEMLLQHLVPLSDATPATPPAIESAAAKMPPDLAERYRKPAGFGHMRAFSLIAEIGQAPYPKGRSRTPTGIGCLTNGASCPARMHG
jgi:hypothetical protein